MKGVPQSATALDKPTHGEIPVLRLFEKPLAGGGMLVRRTSVTSRRRRAVRSGTGMDTKQQVTITLIKDQHGDFEIHKGGCSDLARQPGIPHNFVADTLVQAIKDLDQDAAGWFCERAYTESSRNEGCWATKNGFLWAPCFATMVKEAGILFADITGEPFVGYAGDPKEVAKMIASKPTTGRHVLTAEERSRGAKARAAKADSGVQAIKGLARAAKAQPKTLTVQATVTITIDVESYRLNYGEDDLATISRDVRYAVLSAVGPEGGMFANSIVDASLKEL